MASEVSITDELRIIYQEIIQGCSVSSNGKIFFKHLTELDYIEILRYRLTKFDTYVKEGIPSEKERLKSVFENEEWNQDKEDDITSLRLTIGDNEKNLSRFVVPQQQAGIRKAIEEAKDKLLNLLISRREIIGMTADESSHQEANTFMVYLSLYKDKACAQPLFQTLEEFEAIDSQESEQLSLEMGQVMEKFQESKVRQLSVMPFFLNNFFYSKGNIHTFLQKPTVSFTSHQTLLFSLGQRNLNIMSNCEGTPPDMIGNITPDEILTWYDQQYSVLLGKRNAKK